MATYRLEGLDALGPALEAYLRRAYKALYACLREVIAESAMVKLVDLSPVGNAAVDPTAGKYRASHIPSVGEIQTKVLPNMPAYPIPGIPEVEAVLRGADANSSVFIANAAADERRPDSSYAGLLEGGRRQYSRVSSRRTVWVGSEQAPDGIYGPAVRALLGMRATIVASAIKRAKGRL
jgi:hypothetical protein